MKTAIVPIIALCVFVAGERIAISRGGIGADSFPIVAPIDDQFDTGRPQVANIEIPAVAPLDFDDTISLLFNWRPSKGDANGSLGPEVTADGNMRREHQSRIYGAIEQPRQEESRQPVMGGVTAHSNSEDGAHASAAMFYPASATVPIAGGALILLSVGLIVCRRGQNRPVSAPPKTLQHLLAKVKRTTRHRPTLAIGLVQQQRGEQRPMREQTRETIPMRKAA